jgi:NADH-quinone oxidoreductase subunit G
MVTIEINGKTFEADDNKMIIEVADEHGIHIPRFCYHKKLSIAANCRMCLVEVEKSRKPLPACATPVTDGMRVLTDSPSALLAQKTVMEFLLINHPLDCPICDQGGECELQDVSMGFGRDISRYTEKKRTVDDEDLGSLIETDMTRCIHCTRCVRFGEEVAGVRELGLTGRGENARIGTYVKHAIQSEVSGNVIDLCPVGALTAKPSRYQARAWELEQAASIAPHDCLGSNIYLHTRRGQVMRVVPKENEAINETWASDRDRFSYPGLHSDERLLQPEIKVNGQWRKASWPNALETLASRFKEIVKDCGPEQIAAFCSPSATTEEAYLLQKVMRGLGSDNVDHRLRESDFSDQDNRPMAPVINMPYAELEDQQAIVLLGSNIHREQPLAGLRVRKAVEQNDATAIVINSVPTTYHFNLAGEYVRDYQQIMELLMGVAKVLGADKEASATTLLQNAQITDEAQAIAKALTDNAKSTMVIGALFNHHPHAAIFRNLIYLIARYSDTRVIGMTDGANSAGAWYAGCVPHRQAAGSAVAKPGFDHVAASQKNLNGYLFHGVEPELDCANSQMILDALEQALCVAMVTPYVTDKMREYADILLPSVPFSETSGTFVNLEGKWQSFTGAVKPQGEARPAWKIFRVMGNYFELDGFEYTSSQEVLNELKGLVDGAAAIEARFSFPKELPTFDSAVSRVSEWSIYGIDSIVRRSAALQQSATNQDFTIRVSPQVAKKFNLRHGREAVAMQNGAQVSLPVVIDEIIPENYVAVAAGGDVSAHLGAPFGEIDLK